MSGVLVKPGEARVGDGVWEIEGAGTEAVAAAARLPKKWRRFISERYEMVHAMERSVWSLLNGEMTKFPVQELTDMHIRFVVIFAFKHDRNADTPNKTLPGDAFVEFGESTA